MLHSIKINRRHNFNHKFYSAIHKGFAALFIYNSTFAYEGAENVRALDAFSGGYFRAYNTIGWHLEGSQSRPVYGDNSNIQDVHDDAVDPLFVNPEERDFRLRHDSPLIDMGDADHVQDDVHTDLAGNPRFMGPVDLGAYEFGTRTELSGEHTTDDFRFLGSPATNVSLARLFEPFWSQGILGSDAPHGAPSLYFWDAENGSWQTPESMEEDVDSGRGYLKYIYDDQNFDGEPDGFPKNWGVPGVENDDLVEIALYDGAESDAPGWNMLSNPWPVPISADDLFEALKNVDEAVDLNIYIWDPNKPQHDGEDPEFGEYRILAHGDDAVIPPFQSFFVSYPDGIPGNSATLSLDRNDLEASGEAEPYHVPQNGDEEKLPLVFSIDHETSGSKLAFRLDERVDHIDNLYSATRLSGFRSNYSLLYADGLRGPLSRVHVPGQVEIPLELDIGLLTNQHGEFTLRWNDLSDEWSAYEVTLTDLAEGVTIPVLERDSYTFYIESEEKSRKVAGERVAADAGNSELSEPVRTKSGRDAAIRTQEFEPERRNESALQRNEAYIPINKQHRMRNAASDFPEDGRTIPEMHSLVAGTGENEEVKDSLPTRFVLHITPLATSTNPQDELPQELELAQNYPNPFNPTTLIEYALPEAGDVRIDVFNIIGQRVQTLINRHQQPGYHTATFDGSRLSSGAYIYRIQFEGKTITRKMMLIK